MPCKMVDGKNIQDGDAKQNYYPVIVTQSEFDGAREQIEAKRKNGTYRGGDRRSDVAKNLFTGLLFDATPPGPARPINFQPVERSYIFTAFTTVVYLRFINGAVE